jgi:hypothetical protein
MATTRGSDIKPRYQAGGEWKARLLEKGTRASQTPGKKKGIAASGLDKTMCRRNRSYKHPAYDAIMLKLDGNKRRGKAS